MAARHQRLAIPFQNRRFDADILTGAAAAPPKARSATCTASSRATSAGARRRSRAGRSRGAEQRGEGLLLDLMVHLVNQALVLFGPAGRRVHPVQPPASAFAVVDDDVFVALTHTNGVRSHLFTSTTVGVLGPRFNVLGSKAAFVKHGMDPQEDALLRQAGSRARETKPKPLERLGSACETQVVKSEPGDYPRFYAGVAEGDRDRRPPAGDVRRRRSR